MFYALQSLVGTTLLEQVTLLVNHVLRSEPVASERLRPHAGRTIRLHFAGWPRQLPALPSAAFLVTPAGLLEWCGEVAPAVADLQVSIDASNPALALLHAAAGQRPRIDVAGDAALAADVDWLFDNLRWDVEDDLARLVGPAPARELGRLGRGVAAAVREAARRLGALATRPAAGEPAEPARQ